VFKLFVFIEELDGNVAVGFLQDRCATLVQGLNLVNDCMGKSAMISNIEEIGVGCL
jgi:hypothetical protein